MGVMPSGPCRWRWAFAATVLVLAAPALAADLPTAKPPTLSQTPDASVALPSEKPPPLEPMRRELTVTLPTDKPPPAEPSLADIAGPACVPGHRVAFEEARLEAGLRLADAIRLVRERPDDPHLVRWFGTASRKALVLTLELTAARLAEPDGIAIQCNDPASCGDGRFAYARARDDVLGLCPSFFRARMTGQDSRWGILIHEGSHLAANTSDHAYGPRAALALAEATPEKAGENGDSIEYFVETLPR